MAPPGSASSCRTAASCSCSRKATRTVRAGKRPFHTIIPAFITRTAKPWASFGVMGGGDAAAGPRQIVMNLIDFGMNLQEAGDAPRIQHEGSTEPTGQARR
jgi:gamma-glutamyltranspeptidase/glutathione hydrolase